MNELLTFLKSINLTFIQGALCQPNTFTLSQCVPMYRSSYSEKVPENMKLFRGSTTLYELNKRQYHKTWIYLEEVPQNMNLPRGSTAKDELT